MRPRLSLSNGAATVEDVTKTPELPYTPKRGTPGWYADPIDASRSRWFDGCSWTMRTAQEPPKQTVRRLITHLATVVTAASVLAGAFFVWTLYGTNIVGGVQQSQLRQSLNALAASVPQPAIANSDTSNSLPAPTVPPIPTTGAPVGVIEIPKIGVNYAFSSGTGEAQLAKGPGLWQAGAFPGTPGNATISGHRTTYGAYFRHIDQLVPGDLIYILVPGQPEAVFEVRGSQAVNPGDVAVTDPTPGVRLTLTTCNPPYSASQRLVVQAEEIQGAWASQALPAAQWSFS